MTILFWIGLLFVGALAYTEANKASYDNYLMTMTMIAATIGGLVCLIALS